MNENHSKVLGICIPTYNRAEVLKKNLYNLIDKVSEYNVPIYISDNASTDNTQEIIIELQKIYPFIIYSRNTENIGSDRNFETVLKQCKADYAWLLGDDDTIVGDFGEVHDILSNEYYDALIFANVKKQKCSSVYTDKNKILIDLAGAMTWISGLIINREIIECMNFKRYSHSSFVHTGALLEALCKDPVKVYCYHSPTSARMVDTMQKYYSGFSDVTFDIFTENWMNLICSLPYQYSFSDKRKAIVNLPTAPYRTITLIMYRSWGVYNYQRLRRQSDIIKAAGYCHYYKMLMIAFIPKLLAKGIVKIGKFVRKSLYGF